MSGMLSIIFSINELGLPKKIGLSVALLSIFALGIVMAGSKVLEKHKTIEKVVCFILGVFTLAGLFTLLFG